MKSPIFVPCSPILSLARASNQRSNGVNDFVSGSKTTKGRSVTGPKVLALPLDGAGEGEDGDGSEVAPEVSGAAGEGWTEGAGVGELSSKTFCSLARTSGGRSSFSRSA